MQRVKTQRAARHGESVQVRIEGIFHAYLSDETLVFEMVEEDVVQMLNNLHSLLRPKFTASD